LPSWSGLKLLIRRELRQILTIPMKIVTPAKAGGQTDLAHLTGLVLDPSLRLNDGYI
jgi:hypothetical protein